MSELADYERRIAYALERIGRGVETLTAERPLARAETVAPWDPQEQAAEGIRFEISETPEILEIPEPEPEPQPDPGPSEEVLALQAALQAARVANAQLSDRVRAIREKQETTMTALERRLVQATRVLEAVQTEANRLKRANGELIEVNRALVDAAGALAPHLVNQSMQAELEAMRAARAWEASELADIVAGLAPIVAAHAKAQPAGGGENG